MLITNALRVAAFGLLASAQQNSSNCFPSPPSPDADGKYTISSEGIRAQFIPYGASITNLFVNDTNGVERDIVLGFDNASYYAQDASHPHLGGIPGRYANRIKNGSFAVDGTTYKVVANENGGLNTLHGGSNGWDYRIWRTVHYQSNSITFQIDDPDMSEGFPGRVTGYVTYTVTPHTWHIQIGAKSFQQRTPIMLTSHTYWNLDGFQNPNTATALNHTLSLPFSRQRIGVDGILVPDGSILTNEPGSVNDFWSAPKQIGASFEDPALVGNCGTACKGYDNCYIVGREGSYNWQDAPVATVSSEFSGISMNIFTDQEAFQVYNCGGQNGTLALKKTQGFFDDASKPRTVQQFGCLVLEVQDWIDGINQPAWGREGKQIWGPTDSTYTVQAKHVFSTKPKS